jgi:hypothetical protein
MIVCSVLIVVAADAADAAFQASVCLFLLKSPILITNNKEFQHHQKVFWSMTKTGSHEKGPTN